MPKIRNLYYNNEMVEQPYYQGEKLIRWIHDDVIVWENGKTGKIKDIYLIYRKGVGNRSYCYYNFFTKENYYIHYADQGGVMSGNIAYSPIVLNSENMILMDSYKEIVGIERKSDEELTKGTITTEIVDVEGSDNIPTFVYRELGKIYQCGTNVSFISFKPSPNPDNDYYIYACYYDDTKEKVIIQKMYDRSILDLYGNISEFNFPYQMPPLGMDNNYIFFRFQDNITKINHYFAVDKDGNISRPLNDFVKVGDMFKCFGTQKCYYYFTIRTERNDEMEHTSYFFDIIELNGNTAKMYSGVSNYSKFDDGRYILHTPSPYTNVNQISDWFVSTHTQAIQEFEGELYGYTFCSIFDENNLSGRALFSVLRIRKYSDDFITFYNISVNEYIDIPVKYSSGEEKATTTIRIYLGEPMGGTVEIPNNTVVVTSYTEWSDTDYNGSFDGFKHNEYDESLIINSSYDIKFYQGADYFDRYGKLVRSKYTRFQLIERNSTKIGSYEIFLDNPEFKESKNNFAIPL